MLQEPKSINDMPFPVTARNSTKFALFYETCKNKEIRQCGRDMYGLETIYGLSMIVVWHIPLVLLKEFIKIAILVASLFSTLLSKTSYIKWSIDSPVSILFYATKKYRTIISYIVSEPVSETRSTPRLFDLVVEDLPQALLPLVAKIAAIPNEFTAIIMFSAGMSFIACLFHFWIIGIRYFRMHKVQKVVIEETLKNIYVVEA